MKKLLALSALAHVAIFVLVMRAKPGPLPAPAIPRAETEEATIDLTPEPTAAPTAAVPMNLAVVPSSFYGVASVHEPSPVASATPAETAPYASNGTWVVFGPSLGLSGTGAINPFLGRGALPAGNGTGAAALSADPMYIPENKRATNASTAVGLSCALKP